MSGPQRAPEPAPLPATKLLSRADGLLYRQLAALLREPIAKGIYPTGSELPTESAIGARFGVSLITVRHALRELEGEGLIRKRTAKAAIVADPQRVSIPSFDLERFSDIGANTSGGRLDIKSYRRERSKLASETFGLQRDIACHCLRGVLIVRDEPMAQITIYFPPEIGSRLKRADFDDVVVFHSLQRHLGIRFARARTTLSAELADADLARDLDYPEGAPVLRLQLTYLTTDDAPVELTIARHRADRFHITLNIRNDEVGPERR